MAAARISAARYGIARTVACATGCLHCFERWPAIGSARTMRRFALPLSSIVLVALFVEARVYAQTPDIPDEPPPSPNTKTQVEPPQDEPPPTESVTPPVRRRTAPGLDESTGTRRS